MVSLIKPGARLLRVDGPVIETARLILRPWRASDIADNTRMLSDTETARFITPDHQPVTSELKGWRNAAVISGHWALHGFGMFAVEEKSSGRYIGRVGPYCPPEWPGFEVGWGIFHFNDVPEAHQELMIVRMGLPGHQDCEGLSAGAGCLCGLG